MASYLGEKEKERGPAATHPPTHPLRLTPRGLPSAPTRPCTMRSAAAKTSSPGRAAIMALVVPSAPLVACGSQAGVRRVAGWAPAQRAQQARSGAASVDLSTRRQKCAHAPDDQQTAFNISSHNVIIDPTWATRSNPSSRSPPSRQHSTSESRYSPAAAERGGTGTGKLPYNSLSGGRTAAPFTPHRSGWRGLVGRGGGWLLSNAPAALLAAAAAAAAAGGGGGKADSGMGPLMGPARHGWSRRTPHSVQDHVSREITLLHHLGGVAGEEGLEPAEGNDRKKRITRCNAVSIDNCS